MDNAGDRHAIFDFLVNNTMAADDDRAAFFDFIGAAFEYLAEDLDGHLSFRKADDIHRRLWLSAHGVNVAQRIRRRDQAESIRIIDNRSEEIHGIDNGEIGSQTKHSGVVGRFRPDQHIGVVEFRQLVQDLHEVGGAELSGSTRGLDLLPLLFRSVELLALGAKAV